MHAAANHRVVATADLSVILMGTVRYSYHMVDAQSESVQHNGQNPSPNPPVVSESVILGFKKLVYTFQPVLPNGQKNGPPVTFTWNFDEARGADATRGRARVPLTATERAEAWADCTARLLIGVGECANSAQSSGSWLISRRASPRSCISLSRRMAALDIGWSQSSPSGRGFSSWRRIWIVSPGKPDLTMRQVDDQRALARGTARRLEHHQAAVSEKVGVSAQFAPVEAARRQQVVQDEGDQRLAPRPVRVRQFAFHDEELRVGKKTIPPEWSRCR